MNYHRNEWIFMKFHVFSMEFIDILREYATCPPRTKNVRGGAGCTLLKKINENP
jgi:hypothetical protein